MEKILLSLLIVFMLSACHGTSQSTTAKSEPNTAITTLLPDNNVHVEDPYFVDTQDTIASYGPRSITRNILQDKSGTYWFATWQGIMSYDGKQFTNHTLKEGLKKWHEFSLLEDSRGQLWFGSIGGGVYRYDPVAATSGQKAFTRLTTKDGLLNDYVGCIFEDDAGNIWFGTDEGASVYNPTSGVFTNYTPDNGLCGTSINSITQDKNGAIWFGLRGGADSDVCYFDQQHFTLVTQKDGSRFTNVRHVLEDEKGNMWIGGQDGLFQYEPGSGVLIQRMPNFIGYIYEDSKNYLWLSHGEMDGPSMVLTRYNPMIGGAASFERIHSDQQVFGIIEDKDGKIWFGTPSGAKRYDAANGVITL